MDLGKVPVGKEIVSFWPSFILGALIVFSLLPSPSWGQGKTVKMPVQKPGPLPSATIPEKKEATSPLPKDSASADIDYELEMKKVEALIRLNDKNAEAFFNRAWHAWKTLPSARKPRLGIPQ